MRIHRSSKCSLKVSTENKRSVLKSVLTEYGNVVNFFIDLFWDQEKVPSKLSLLKDIVNLPETWLSARLRKVAARDAIDMIRSAKERWDEDEQVRPVHKGKQMKVSSTIADLQPVKNSTEFDAWLHLASVGNKVILDIPIKFHQHFNRLSKKGKRLNSYIITDKYVQFDFEIETGKKKTKGKGLGIDTGIKALASLSDGRQLGRNVESIIEAIKRCQYGSKRQKRLRRSLRQTIDEIAKQICEQSDLRLVVVEDLKRMNDKTKVKRRLTKNMRRSLGAWNYRYWLDRIQQRCEDNRVVYRSVNPAYTSQECQVCGHTERRNRSGEIFECRRCGHNDNADINAARNILGRFLSGKYGSGFQAIEHD